MWLIKIFREKSLQQLTAVRTGVNCCREMSRWETMQCQSKHSNCIQRMCFKTGLSMRRCVILRDGDYMPIWISRGARWGTPCVGYWDYSTSMFSRCIVWFAIPICVPSSLKPNGVWFSSAFFHHHSSFCICHNLITPKNWHHTPTSNFGYAFRIFASLSTSLQAS